MGGNAIIGGFQGAPIKNDPWNVGIAKDAIQWLRSEFGGMGINLVPSGSTSHMVRGVDICLGWENDGTAKRKESYGDIDLMFDSEKSMGLETLLYRIVGEDTGAPLKLLAYQKTDQYITIWETAYGQRFQIDFEPSEFVGDAPTDWALFCHSSPLEDLEMGIKGVFHKHLLRALNAPDVRDVLIKKSKGFKETKSAEYALSVSGLRRKLYPILAPDQWGNAKPLYIDGKNVYHEVNKKDWTTDLGIIFAFYFGNNTSPYVNVKNMGSFLSLARMIKETRNGDECLMVMNGFVNTIWGKGAQKLYRNNDKLDEKEKNIAFKALADILQTPTILWEQSANVYYGRETEEYQTL